MEKEVKQSLKTLPSYEDYPFKIEGIINRIFTLKEDERVFEDTKTGQLVSLKAISKTKNVKHDSSSYTKVFKKPMAEFKDLSVPASNLLYLIISKLEINCPFICVHEDDFFEHCNYAKGSVRLYYKAVTELIDRNVIKKKSGFTRCFWINANIIFNGDRTKIQSKNN